MDSWLVILVIILTSALVGGLLVLQFVPRQTRLNLKLIFAALTVGIVSIGWLALLLAEIGWFSVATLTASWLASVVILTILTWRRYQSVRDGVEDQQSDERGSSWRPKISWSNWLEFVFLAGWIAAAGWLFFRPHESIMGGADAGVYVSLGAEIAQNGGFRIVDEGLAALDRSLYPVTLRQLPANRIASSYLVPGFYVTSAGEGTVVPQFYPLHPVWQAAAFGLSGSIITGVHAELLMTGLWMFLASLAIYMTARELAGWGTAVLTLLGLSIMALQVWFARYPTTEALTQFLLWAGLWGVLMWLGDRQPSSLWAFLSGIVLGSVFLVRIDVIVMLPILVLLVVALWARGWRRSDWWFAIPFAVLVVHSFVHAILLSAPYFYEHIGYGLGILWMNWLVPLVALLFGVIFLAVIYLFRGRFAALRRYRRPVLMTLIGVTLLFALYGWFIRPYSAEPVLQPDTYSEGLILLTNHENWLRLGWYLSPIGMWLGILGSCLLLWRVEWKTAVFLAIGFLFTAVYLWNVRANPHQVYVMRRYVPMVAPFFIVSAAYLTGDLIKQARSKRDAKPWQRMGYLILGFLLAIAWLLGLGWSARGFISQVDYKGVVAQLADINDDLPPNSVLIFNDQSPVGLGDFWGTPLKFIFGHDVFTLRDLNSLDDVKLAESIKSWQNNGRSVVWIGDPAWLKENEFQFQEQVHQIQSNRLESSYEYKPRAVVPSMWILHMALIDQG
jgi:4-amino-4-deoxy-L-arabinose transferase-like glycosyltransferase